MENYMYLVPVAAVLALLFAAYLAAKVSKQDAGTDRMKEIAGYIHEGAMAFLKREYKMIAIFVAVLFVILTVTPGLGFTTAVCFLVGAIFSILAGFFGMQVATKANVRTANAAKISGMNKKVVILTRSKGHRPPRHQARSAPPSRHQLLAARKGETTAGKKALKNKIAGKPYSNVFCPRRRRKKVELRKDRLCRPFKVVEETADRIRKWYSWSR